MAKAPAADDDWQPFATVLRAHGTAGAVRLRWRCAIRALVAWPLAVRAQHRRLGSATWSLGVCRVLSANEMIASLGGALSREAVDAWRGAELFVPPAVAPPEGDHELYLYRLIGRLAVLPDGAELGTVVAAYDHGAGPVLGLRSCGSVTEDRLLPLSAARVGDLLEAPRRVVIDIAPDLLAND